MLTRIRELVSPLVTQYQLGDGIEAARVHKAWPIAVTHALGAAFPVPESLVLKDRILWIAMPPAVVAQEVQLSKKAILADLALHLGDGLVTDIRFRVGSANHMPGDIGRQG